jgi:DNA-binding NtrC family response regulator
MSNLQEQAMRNNSILWSGAEGVLTQPLWDQLRRMGFKVLLQNGVPDSLEKIATVSPGLWVKGIQGDGDGSLTLVRAVKTSCPELPVVIVDQKPSIEQGVMAIKSGASDYLPANVSSDHLVAVLEQALAYPAPNVGKARPRPSRSPSAHQVIAADVRMVQVLKLAQKIAPKRTTVLVQGESGTGKEVLARYIHHESDRRDGPFVAVNCAALPETLLESELFGHEKGAFTGAVSQKKGKFELAHGGTLLLDEISEMDLSLQAKLLRVLQEREIDRVGSQSPMAVDVRVIATTNRDLEAETKAGRFRLDLYYRLNVVPLHLPPLRERREDIIPLARFFLEKHAAFNHEPIKTLSMEMERTLREREWPGNVRELENLMERAVLLVEGEVIHEADLNAMSGVAKEALPLAEGSDFKVVPLREMEKQLIFRALENHRGNRTHAAEILGISVRTLRNKLNEYRSDPDGVAAPEIG